jgi:hypothetical protein
VLAYILDGLETGDLFFSVTSLHEVGMTGGGNPNFFTRDSMDPAALPPSLAIEFDVLPIGGGGPGGGVPEPASAGLLVLGLAAVLRRRGRSESHTV